MADIKNTLELVSLVAVLAKTLKEAKADGTVDINDLALLMQVFPTLGPAIGDVDQVPAEVKDLDAAEIAELAVAVQDIVGDVAGEKYAAIAEHALKAGVEIFEVVKLLKA